MGELAVFTNVLALIKAKRKWIGIIAFVLICVGAVLTVQRAADYSRLKKENREIATKLAELSNVQEQLTYAEEQLNLYQESTNALTQQVSDLNAINEDLTNQLEELLNVQETVPVITRNVLEEQISSLSELVTQKYMYRNASRQESDKTWLWGWTMPFSDTSLLATYDGVITTSIDLKGVKFNVNELTKTITVTIPSSKIFDHNIPQETINVLEVKNNLFNQTTFNDYNKFISAEKSVMEQIAIDQGLLTQADEEAKNIIEAFLKTVPGIDQYKLVFK